MFERKSIVALCFVFALFSVTQSTVASDDDDKKSKQRAQSEWVTPGWVVVKFKDAINIPTGAAKTGVQRVDAIAEKYQVSAVEMMFPFLANISAAKRASYKGIDRLQTIYRLKIDPASDPFQVAAQFSQLPEVEYAEPLFRQKLNRQRTQPAFFEP